jgi:LysM repeat protein
MSMSGTLPKFSRYRVKRGDSLWKISERAYGRGDLWEGISEANHLRRGKPILAGQELIIPTARRPMHRELHGVPPCTPTTPQPLSTHTTAKAPPIPLQKVKGAEAATKTGPYQLARTVRYPPFKYELDGIVAEYHTPVVDYELSYTGEVTLQKEGQILEGLTFTKEGIEVEYKKEASGAFDALFTKSTMKAGNGKAEVSLALGSTLKSGGRVLATSEFSVVSPTEVKYSFKGQEIKGTFR